MKKLRTYVFINVLCLSIFGSVCSVQVKAEETGSMEVAEGSDPELKTLEEAGVSETETLKDVVISEDVQALQENDTSVIIPMDIYAKHLSVDDIRMENPYNDLKNLKLPAQITRQGDYYFIVDTYNDQVLYASDLWKPIGAWRVMDRKLNKPHAIASDGSMYLVVDTDNNRVVCYEYINGRFQRTQQFEDVGKRPHYIQYDALSESFFVWSSVTGDMYIIKKEPVQNTMYIQEIRHIYELDGFYVRSFSIEGDEVLFPSGNNGYMIVADKDTLRVKARYQVPMEISGMAFAKKIGSYYYMTVSTDDKLNHENARMIRTSDLETLSLGIYENVTGYFKDMKVPYYIDRMNGSYYVTSHESKKCVYMFNIADDVIKDVQTVH